MDLDNIDVPEKVKECLNKLAKSLKNILARDLTGIYVHGSIAMGCFNPMSSDIDVLVVVKDKLNDLTRVNIIKTYNTVRNNCDNKIELYVVIEKLLKPLVFPTHCELYFSGEGDDVSESTDSTDIVSGVMIIKKCGICLYGKSIDEVFGEVSKKNFLESIVKDSEWSYNNVMNGPDTGTGLVPAYAVINFCRVLAYIRSGLVLSKKEGAEWGLQNMPVEFHQVIRTALDEYLNIDSSRNVDLKTLKNLAIYFNQEIKNETED